jgi:2-dehydropantoate 2-reductase
VAGLPGRHGKRAEQAGEGDEPLNARIVVVGTGAMATLFAARLARSGHAHVTLAGRWREALHTAAAAGLTLTEPEGTFRVAVATALLADTLGPADFVLVLVKSHQTDAVALAAAEARAPSGLVVTLQNGLGNRERLALAAGPDNVALGTVTLGATLLAPGHVRSHPGHVALGREPLTEARAERLVRLLRIAGIAAHLEPHIDRLVWRKLAVNCAINPLTALLGVTNGALLDSSDAPDMVLRAAREVGAVAAARGIDLDGDPGELALEVARTTASNRSSMLQDLERGAPTEIGALCGEVVREGRRLGVPTPLNEQLQARIQERQRQGRGSVSDLRL